MMRVQIARNARGTDLILRKESRRSSLIVQAGSAAARPGREKESLLTSRDGAFENHALTLLPTMPAFAGAARTLADRGTPESVLGLVALDATLRAPIAAEGCFGHPACGEGGKGHDGGCFVPPAVPLGTFEFAPNGERLAVSRGHVRDHLAEAARAGALDLREALTRLAPAAVGAAFGDGVARGLILVWTMTASFEEASAIATTLLALGLNRVCTFTRPVSRSESG